MSFSSRFPRSLFLGLILVVPFGCGQRKPAPVAAAPVAIAVPTFPAPDAPPGYLTAAPPVAVDGPTPPERTVEEYPLPQNPELQKNLEDERIKRNLADTVGAFERLGKTKETWSPLARKALELVARSDAMDIGRRDDLMDQWEVALQAAIDAGCDDPLVRYFSWREKRRLNAYIEQAKNEIVQIAERIDRDDYPIPRRLEVRFAECSARAEALSFPAVPIPAPPSNRRIIVRKRKDVVSTFDPVWPLFVAAAKERDVFVDRSLVKIADSLIDAYDESGRDRQEGYERVEKALL